LAIPDNSIKGSHWCPRCGKRGGLLWKGKQKILGNPVTVLGGGGKGNRKKKKIFLPGRNRSSENNSAKMFKKPRARVERSHLKNY